MDPGGIATVQAIAAPVANVHEILIAGHKLGYTNFSCVPMGQAFNLGLFRRSPQSRVHDALPGKEVRLERVSSTAWP